MKYEWAQAVQDRVREAKEKTDKSSDQTTKKSSQVVPTGDGAFVIFLDSNMIEAPLMLAAELTARYSKFPCDIRMAIHSGVVTIISDSKGDENFSGDGIIDTGRIIDSAGAWEIVTSIDYASLLKNIDDDLKKLFSGKTKFYTDKHKIRQKVDERQLFFPVSDNYNSRFYCSACGAISLG